MAGRHPFTPTEKERGMVEALAGLGLAQEDISLLIINPATGKHIDAKTLRKAFAHELSVGGAKAKAEIARTIFKMATEDKSVSAALFLAKTRLGWKEPPANEQKDAGGTAHEDALEDLELSLTMQQKTRDARPEGYVQVTVQPSVKIRSNAGIYILVNDHYQVVSPDKSVGCDEILTLLEERFEASIRNSEGIVDQIMSLREAR